MPDQTVKPCREFEEWWKESKFIACYHTAYEAWQAAKADTGECAEDNWQEAFENERRLCQIAYAKLEEKDKQIAELREVLNDIAEERGQNMTYARQIARQALANAANDGEARSQPSKMRYNGDYDFIHQCIMRPDEVIQHVSMLWRNYALCHDETLEKKARELKRQLLAAFPAASQPPEPVSGALERGAAAVKRLFDLASTPPDSGFTPEDVAKTVLDAAGVKHE